MFSYELKVSSSSVLLIPDSNRVSLRRNENCQLAKIKKNKSHQHRNNQKLHGQTYIPKEAERKWLTDLTTHTLKVSPSSHPHKQNKKQTAHWQNICTTMTDNMASILNTKLLLVF